MDQQSAARQYMDDEISLIDIAIVLYRRKGVIFSTLILCVIAATVISFLKGTSYEYSTAIKIGTMDDGSLIETLQAVETRLQKSYIPEILRKHSSSKGVLSEDVKYDINVTVPKAGDFVVVSSKAKESDSEEIKKILQELVMSVISVHSKKLVDKRTDLQQEINDLVDEKKLYTSNIGKAGNDDPYVLMDMSKELRELKARLNILTESSMQFEPNRSVESVGVSKPLIVVLGIVLGLMLGMFAAFLAEFLAKAREQLKDQAA